VDPDELLVLLVVLELLELLELLESLVFVAVLVPEVESVAPELEVADPELALNSLLPLPTPELESVALELDGAESELWVDLPLTDAGVDMPPLEPPVIVPVAVTAGPPPVPDEGFGFG
jgi:hypothetical protein